MGYNVGDKTNLHSENYVREHGNRQRTSDGSIPTPTIGHKGQTGSDPTFPDTADHIVEITSAELSDLGSTVNRKCSCGFEWTVNEKLQRKNVFGNTE